MSGWVRGRNAGTLVAVLLAVVVAVSGCLGLGDRGEREREAMLAEIQQELAAHPDVVDVEVQYIHRLTLSHTTMASITVPAGTDVEDVMNEAARLIWLSEIHPLSSLTVFIRYPGERHSHQSRSWSVSEESRENYPELEQRYGPRPVPS